MSYALDILSGRVARFKPNTLLFKPHEVAFLREGHFRGVVLLGPDGDVGTLVLTEEIQPISNLFFGCSLADKPLVSAKALGATDFDLEVINRKGVHIA